ncbi:MAG: hypothetical protein ACREH8_20275, partial [Opitutaceae bacterium]
VARLIGAPPGYVGYDAEKLRHFLTTDSSVGTKLGPKVAAYLKAVSATEFLDKILIPLVWDTGSPDETDVRAAVESKLAVMASKDFAASPLHAANLAESLFAAVVTLALSKEKIALTRAALGPILQDPMIESFAEISVEAFRIHDEALRGADRNDPLVYLYSRFGFLGESVSWPVRSLVAAQRDDWSSVQVVVRFGGVSYAV